MDSKPVVPNEIPLEVDLSEQQPEEITSNEIPLEEPVDTCSDFRIMPKLVPPMPLYKTILITILVLPVGDVIGVYLAVKWVRKQIKK
jgi:hypothetical protein